MIGEDEYQTWDTLPEFAERDLKPLGYRVTIVKADEADKNNFPGPGRCAADRRSARRQRPAADSAEPNNSRQCARILPRASRSRASVRHATPLRCARPIRPPAPATQPGRTFDPEVLGGHYT